MWRQRTATRSFPELLLCPGPLTPPCPTPREPLLCRVRNTSAHSFSSRMQSGLGVLQSEKPALGRGRQEREARRREEAAYADGADPGRCQGQSGPAWVREEAGTRSKGWSAGLEGRQKRRGCPLRAPGVGFAASSRAQGAGPVTRPHCSLALALWRPSLLAAPTLAGAQMQFSILLFCFMHLKNGSSPSPLHHAYIFHTVIRQWH